MVLGASGLEEGGRRHPSRGLPAGRGVLPEDECARPPQHYGAPRPKRRDIASIALDPNSDVLAVTIAELLRAHWEIHRRFRAAERDPRSTGLSIDDAVNLHARVVDELFQRGVQHPPPPDDGLDADSSEFERHANQQPDWTKPPNEVQATRTEATAIVESLEKSIWGSPAGKTHLAKRLVEIIPSHRTYVEPFAGGAQVLFAKEPSPIEVVNDLDPEIAFAFRFARDLTKEQLERLHRKKWTGDKVLFRKLYETLVPEDPVERFYRFAYLSRFSFNKLRRGTMPDKNVDVDARFVDRLEKFAPRLRKLQVRCADYEKVIEEFDASDTFFFLDPPYAGYDAGCGVGAGHKDWDEERFGRVLRAIKGRFLVTYGTRGDPDLFKGFHVQRWRHTSGVGTSQGHGLRTTVTLVVTNFDTETPRRRVSKLESCSIDTDEDPEIEDRDASIAPDDSDELDAGEAVDKAQAFGTFGGSHHYAKRILPLIPDHHETYVEPFAGAAAVLYAKEPSAKEVIADNDADVVFLHRFIKSMTPKRVEELARRFEWTCTEESFVKARDMEPKDEVERFYKLVFVRTHARDCRPDGTHPAKNHLGSTTDPAKYLRAAERLKDVSILHQDYKKTIKQHDGPKTFFFLDPPYPSEWYDKDAVIEIGEFIEVLRSIKGDFIAVLNDSPENSGLFKSVGHIFRLKVHEASGTGGGKKASRLFCASFRINKHEVEKYLFGYPAGKAKMANKLLPLIPEHEVYIEPFAGSAAIFFDKDPAPVEILNDRSDEVMGVLRAVKALTDAEFEQLGNKNWVSRKSLHASLRNAKPESRVEKVYRYLYLSRCSFYTGVGGTYSAASAGTNMREGVMRRLEKSRERFHKGVKILVGDYEQAIKAHDSKDAFIFLDPPYPGYNINVGESEFDEARFRKVLDGIKGKFLVTYGVKGKLDTTGFHVRKIRAYRSLANMPGVKPTTVLETLLISNFKLPSSVAKALEETWLDEDPDDFEEIVDISDADEVLQEAGHGVDEDGVDRASASTHETVKQADPYLEIPSEERKYRYVVQHHFRGSSMHADFRIGFRPNELLIGWTMNTMIAGAIKEPVVILSEAKAVHRRMKEISKIDWNTGEWAKRQKPGAGTPVRTEILCERKAPAPWAWINVEGKTKDPEPGKPPPVGGTRNFPGVFHIVDDGLCEFGTQKPSFHEYFPQGDALNYRLLFRLLRVERKTEKRAMPCEICKTAGADLVAWWADVSANRSPVCEPCLDEWTGRIGRVVEKQTLLPPSAAPDQTAIARESWIAIRPDDLTPTVLSEREAEEGWMPPLGVSALPQAIRTQVPEAHRYWEANTRAKAKVTRDALVDAIKDGRVKIDMAAPYRRRRTKAAAPGRYEARILVPIIKVDQERRLITGEVLIPDEVDAQNDTISAEIIEKAEHRFLANYGRNGGTKLGVMHKKFGDVGVDLAESWIAKENGMLAGRKIKKGTWLMTIKVVSDAIWNQVKRGELTGFSIGGVAVVR